MQRGQHHRQDGHGASEHGAERCDECVADYGLLEIWHGAFGGAAERGADVAGLRRLAAAERDFGARGDQHVWLGLDGTADVEEGSGRV